MKKLFLLVSVFLSGVSTLHAASQYTSIDTEVFALQKSFVSDIAKTLQIDSMSGTRQTGSMTLSTKVDTSTASGSVSLTLDPYTITLDGKSGNSDMQYRGRVVFDIRSSDYRYDSVKDDYIRTPVHVTGHVNFEVALIQADGDIYMKLTSIDGVLTGDAETQKSFDRMIIQAEKYEDKTYKLPGGSMSSFEPEDVYEMVRSGFSTLMEAPLFTVVSKNKDGSYKLRINTETLKKLGISSRPSSRETITYRSISGKKEIRLSPKLLPKMNYITLSEADGKRSLSGRVYSRSRYSTSDMSFSVSKDMFSLKAKDNSSDFSVLWKAGIFTLDFASPKTQWTDGWTLSIKGPLSADMRAMDLAIMWKGKTIGNMSSSKSGNLVNYKMNLSVVESLWSVIFDMKGNYSDNRGDYTILPPKIYELLD